MDSIDVELSGASSTPAERTSTAAAGAGEGSWRRMRRSIAGSTANAGGNGSPGSMRKGSTRNLLSRKSSRAILARRRRRRAPVGAPVGGARAPRLGLVQPPQQDGGRADRRSLLGGKKTASAMEHSYYRQTKWRARRSSCATTATPSCRSRLVRRHALRGGGREQGGAVFHTSQGQQVREVTAPHVIGSIVFIGRRKLVAGTYGGLVHFYDVCEEAEEVQVKVNEGQQIECGVRARRHAARRRRQVRRRDRVRGAVRRRQRAVRPGRSEIIRVEPPGTTLALALDEDCRVLATGGDAKIVQLGT